MDTSDMHNTQSRSLPSFSLSFLSADLIWFDVRNVHLLVSIESLPSQWRNTIQPQ